MEVLDDRERSRKRAVQLKPAALEDLKLALHARWQKTGGTKKLTREARADILGLSVATSERLLAGKGVDRPTLTHVYRNLGLEWSENLCECPKEMPSPDLLEAELAPRTQVVPTPKLARQLWGLPIGIVVFVGLISFRPVAAEHAWKPAYHTALAEGSTAFHDGKFAEAERHLAIAVRLAREKNAGRELSSALRMQADLASGGGDLERAWKLYGEAVQIRRAFADDPSIPAILEALGDLETRIGRFEDARVHLHQSLEGFRKSGDSVGIAMACRNLGTLIFLQGNLEAAEIWLQTSQSALRGAKKADLETDVKARMALVLRDRNRLNDASRSLQECLDYWIDRKHTRWIAVTQQQLGTVYIKMGQPDLARRLFETSRDNFKIVGDVRGYADSTGLVERASIQAMSSVTSFGMKVR